MSYFLIIGAVFGSFLNAWIWRTRVGRTIWRERSVCVHCNVTLGIIDLIPVCSFIILKGKCRSCKENISCHYPLVEIVTGVLFTWVAYYHSLYLINPAPQIIRDCILVSLLVFVFVYDLYYMEILDRVTTIPAVILFGISWWLGWQEWGAMLIGASIGAGFFLLQYLLSKGKWVGGGDIRLGLFMGIILGWPNILVGLLLAYIFGAVAGVMLILLKRRKIRSEIPFGTFLTVGTLVAMFWGTSIINWYMSLL